MIGKRFQMIVVLIFLHQLLFAQGNEMAMNMNAFAFTASETPQDVILTSFLEQVEKDTRYISIMIPISSRIKGLIRKWILQKI